MQLNPNTVLIVSTSRVRGGSRTRRIKLNEHTIGTQGEGLKTETKVVREIHDVDEHTQATRYVQKAKDLIRAVATNTIIGWICAKERLGTLDADLAELAENVRAFNARARTCQVAIGALQLDVRVALGPETARALADHVREEMVELKGALQAGDLSKVRAIHIRTKNLPALSVGVQAQSIKFALEESVSRARDLREAINKRSESPESAGRSLTPESLAMIDAAIGMFTYDPDEDHSLDLAGGI